MRVFESVVPSLAVLGLFWFAIRALVQADRRERIAQARADKAESQRLSVAASRSAATPDSGVSGRGDDENADARADADG